MRIRPNMVRKKELCSPSNESNTLFLYIYIYIYFSLSLSLSGQNAIIIIIIYSTRLARRRRRCKKNSWDVLKRWRWFFIHKWGGN
jgi:hypothetical protein